MGITNDINLGLKFGCCNAEYRKEEGGKISLKVDLSSFGSLLVVFKDKIEAEEYFPAYENYDKKLNLDKVWAIKFPHSIFFIMEEAWRFHDGKLLHQEVNCLL